MAARLARTIAIEFMADFALAIGQGTVVRCGRKGLRLALIGRCSSRCVLQVSDSPAGSREAETETEAEVVLRRAHLLQQNTGSPSVDDTGSDPTFRAGHTGPTRLELATVAVVEPPTQSSSSSIA